MIPCFAIKYTSNLIISNGCWNSVYAIILQYRPCANIVSVCHLESVNQPEKCTSNTSRRLGWSSETMNIQTWLVQEKLHLTTIPHCLYKRLKRSNTHYTRFNSRYMKSADERSTKKGCLPVFNIVIYYKYSFKAKMTRAYPGE